MASPSPSSSSSPPISSRLSRPWPDLNPDLLLSILSRLAGADLLLAVSAVCASWRAAARNPKFWRAVDLSDWDSVRVRVPDGVGFGEVLDRALGFGNGIGEVVEEVYLPDFADGRDLVLVAERLPNLSYFSFPNSNINQEEICAALAKFKSLKGMAIDQVFFQSNDALSLISSNFPDLSELKLLGGEFHLYKYLVAMIVKFLPKLRKLEMREMEISTSATLILLDELENLEYLDISGYDGSGITKEVIEKAARLKAFIWHSNRDLGEFLECANCGKEENEGPNCQCVIGEKVMEWLTNT